MCDYRHHVYAKSPEFSCDIQYEGEYDTALDVILSQHHPKVEIFHEWHTDVLGGDYGKTKWLDRVPTEVPNTEYEAAMDNLFKP